MNQKHSEILGLVHDRFAGLVKLYQEMEKQPRKYGTDEYLTSSEIHLIELIGDADANLSVTDLAKNSRVTKGAISQHLKKLEKKGLTTKEEDPTNVSRSRVSLTSKGKAAYYSHRYWHETMDGGYLAYLSTLEADKIEFLLEFMNVVERFMQSVIASND